MSEIDALDERLRLLEEKVAFQDETIETLNQTVTDQWKLIDRLKKRLKDMDDQIYELENNAGMNAPANQKPPHY
mgnify:CR=1 FL=1